MNMEALLPLIIQAIAGGAGGGILGQLLKSKNLGPLANIAAGAVGGLITGQGLNAAGILAQLGPMLGGPTVVGGLGALLGGGVLQAIAAQVLGKRPAA
jgi:hypothetical protein